MFIDSATFPIVWMRQAAPSKEPPQAPFDEFANLLARRRAFVFLSEEGFSDGEHKHTPEERKQTSLWMKKNKVEIRAFVKALVQIEPSAAKRLAGKAFAIVFSKFWGYPLLMTASREEALEIARNLLDEPLEAPQASVASSVR
jgi:hypothetical protein